MATSLVTRRLYFAELDGALLCVGSDGYAGPYYTSELVSLPEELDPVGMTLAEVEGARAEARRAQAAEFVARRRALTGGS